MNPAENKEFTEKYMELQMIDQQLNAMNQQMTTIDKQLMEFQMLKDNIEDMKKTKKGVDMMVPLGGGIFAKAKLEEHDNLLMSVGGNIAVEKPIPETQKVIDNQIKSMNDAIKQMESEFQQLSMASAMIREEVQAMAAEMKQEPQQQ